MIQAAAYCRVSTEKEDQANSFESQQRYFREYICQKPDWALYQIYADEGISGTSTKKRTAFHQMIQDACMGKFQMILTKEVSRFSRNILDTIAYTRKLNAHGVGVVFLNDGIDTREPDAELRLSIMGSLAQEESRKTSSRVKWGQTRRMEQGVVFGHSLLGYDVKDGHLTVNRVGAEVVKLIFYKYGVEKKGTTVIARELQEAGFCTYQGSTAWSTSHLVKILKNEKYVGDLVQKKTITPDYLTHAKKYNHGEEELVTIRDHHEPIIDRALWDVVQRELEKRNRHGALGAGHSNRYLFSGKIKCGACGASFVSRKKYRRDGTFYRRWSCYTAVHEGAVCRTVQDRQVGCGIGQSFREETALELLRQSLRTLDLDWDTMEKQVADLVRRAIQRAGQDSRGDQTGLEMELKQLCQRREAALDAFLARLITEPEMRQMVNRYDGEIERIQKKLDDAREQWGSARELVGGEQKIRALVQGEQVSEAFYKDLLDHLVVYPGGKISVKLKYLPQRWSFVLGEEPGGLGQNDPSVPISVSSPFASG